MKILKALDIGCGYGYFTNYLSGKYAETYGLDMNKKFLKFAKKKFHTPKFVEGFAENLPFKDNYFDAIYCHDILEHVIDLNKVLKEIKRVAKKNCVLDIIIPHWKSEKFLTNIRKTYPEEIGHLRIFKRYELEKKLEKNGFIIKKSSYEQFIKNIELAIILSRGPINSQFGENTFGNSKLWVAFFHLFMKDLFRTPLKYFFPIWLITLPLGIVLSKIFPKSVNIVAIRK